MLEIWFVHKRLVTYHLEPLLHWGSTFKVCSSGGNVVVNFLLAQVDHVAGEERLAVGLEVSLISVQETIQPWKELLGAVISVEDNWDTVCWSNGTDVVSSSDTSSNGSLLLAIGNTLFRNMSAMASDPTPNVCIYLSGEVSSTTLRHLQDDGRLSIAGSLEGCYDGGGRSAVLYSIVSMSSLSIGI